MAQSNKPLDIQKIRLCAQLAKFAYTSGNPGLEISTNDQLAKEELSKQIKQTLDWKPKEIVDFKRFYTVPWVPWWTPWFITKNNQYKYFHSYAYFCHLKTADDINRIIVAFRGTWFNTKGTGKWFDENVSKSERRWLPRIHISSNYGISDFWHDAILIRIPYRPGVVWKWYTYFGSLIVERTCESLRWPRTVALDWMSRPHESLNTIGDCGNVHLGFWSLWASPEGFARYATKGCNSELSNKSDVNVLQRIIQALEETKDEETEVYVVGHSLGGAVSCFAALDIAKELKRFQNVTMFHVTFGAPPVGTKAFAKYFDTEIHPHQSLGISHSRDMVPQCFSWCGSKRCLGWLGWWGNWSGVGQKGTITRAIGEEPSLCEGSKRVWFKNKLMWGGVWLLLAGLYASSMVAIPISAVCYFLHWKYYKGKGMPASSYNDAQIETPQPLEKDVGLKYHELQKYIELLGDESDLEITDSEEENETQGDR